MLSLPQDIERLGLAILTIGGTVFLATHNSWWYYPLGTAFLIPILLVVVNIIRMYIEEKKEK